MTTEPTTEPTTMQETRHVTVWGYDLRVSVRPGSPDRPPLLLCNGIGARLELFQRFIDVIDPDIEVVSFDVPGVGGSAVPRMPYTIPMMGAIVDRMMTVLGYDKFDVLGISWGGGLAQQIAFSHPRRCRRLVLVATATGSLMVPAGPSVLTKMTTPRRYRDPGFAREQAALLYGGQMRQDPDLARRVLQGHGGPVSWRGYSYQLLAGAGWTSLPFLRLIRQPTLILAGNDDPIIPLANARIMHKLLPNSRLHVYDDGHLGLLTSAEELVPIVSEFLR